MIHVEASVIIDKPAGVVFGVIGDPEQDPQWHFDVVEASRSTNGDGGGNGAIAPGWKYRWVFDYMGEGRQEAVAEVVAVEPNRRLDILANAGPLVQTISYSLEPVDSGSSRITRVLDMSHESMPDHMESEIEPHVKNRGYQYLTRLKQLLEGGTASTDDFSCMCSDPG